MVQLRSWMIPAEACPGTFIALEGGLWKNNNKGTFEDSEWYKIDPG